MPQFFNGIYWNALPHLWACSLRRCRQMNRAPNMRPAHFALRLHPCRPRTRGVSHRQGRMAHSALFLLIPPARKSAGHIRNRRSAVAQRGSRGLLYSRAKFREDDAMGAAPSQESRLNCLQAEPSPRQGALHNASFRRGIGRVSGMCRSLSLCSTVSRRRPAPPGRSPRFPRPRGYTHGNGR